VSSSSTPYIYCTDKKFPKCFGRCGLWRGNLKSSNYNDPKDKKRFINSSTWLNIKMPLVRAGGGSATETQMVGQYGQFSASCVRQKALNPPSKSRTHSYPGFGKYLIRHWLALGPKYTLLMMETLRYPVSIASLWYCTLALPPNPPISQGSEQDSFRNQQHRPRMLPNLCQCSPCHSRLNRLWLCSLFVFDRAAAGVVYWHAVGVRKG